MGERGDRWSWLPWRRQSVGAKLAFITASVLTVASILLVVLLSRHEYTQLVEAKQRAGEMVTDLFAASVGAPLDFRDQESLEAEIDHLSRNPSVATVTVWAADEEAPLSSWRRDDAGKPPQQAVKTATAQVLADRIELFRPAHSVAEDPVGFVAVTFSLARENEIFEQTRLRILWMTLLVAFGVGLLMFGLARRQIVSRVTELAEAARALQEHGVEPQIVVRHRDEIGELVGAFKSMAKAVVERERRLEEELEVAQRIQMSILPRNLAVGGLDISACMVPATEVGGDYYDVLPVRDGAWIGIGDVSGHGLNSGLVMLMMQSIIASLVRRNPDASPSEVVAVLNDVLVDNVRVRLEADDHATLSVLRYTPDGRIGFAGAHEDLLVLRARSGEVESIATPGPWVGIQIGLGDRAEESTLQLEDGDLLLLYTDGVTEARNEDRRLFDMDRLIEAFRESRDRTPDEIRQHILDRVLEWAKQPEDDVTLLVARYRAPRPEAEPPDTKAPAALPPPFTP